MPSRLGLSSASVPSLGLHSNVPACLCNTPATVWPVLRLVASGCFKHVPDQGLYTPPIPNLDCTSHLFRQSCLVYFLYEPATIAPGVQSGWFHGGLVIILGMAEPFLGCFSFCVGTTAHRPVFPSHFVLPPSPSSRFGFGRCCTCMHLHSSFWWEPFDVWARGVIS